MALPRIQSSRIGASPVRSGKILRASLIISFLLHLALFFALQSAFSLNWLPQELRTYRVELIRSPVKDIDTKDLTGTNFSRTLGKQKAPPEESQDTISLDTHDKRYVSYATIIKGRIMANWKYPEQAKKNLIEGKLMVIFSLDKSGNLKRMEIVKGSRFEILDSEAIRAIKSSAPFPPFPPSITVSRLNIKATFNYRIAAHN